MLRQRIWALAVAVTLAGPIVTAPVSAQWSIMSSIDRGQLRGKAIVDVGEAANETWTTPSHREYDSTWDQYRWVPGESITWTEFRGHDTLCFSELYSLGVGDEAALLLIDKDEIMYLAILKTSVGSIDVDVDVVRPIQCPSRV